MPVFVLRAYIAPPSWVALFEIKSAFITVGNQLKKSKKICAKEEEKWKMKRILEY